MDWVTKAEEELEESYGKGEITTEEYKRFMRELHEEAEEAGYYEQG